MRIIAGSARGRRFEAPEGERTRPTLDRVKEAMFGMLQFRIPGATVLDLFSGSGNLGLEAASRGASCVVCNDHDRACAALIRKNAAALSLDRVVRVLCLDYRAALEQLKQEGLRFDIALLDAPYADGASTAAAEILFRDGLMKENGTVIVEHERKHPPVLDETVCKISDIRHYGYVGLATLERA